MSNARKEIFNQYDALAKTTSLLSVNSNEISNFISKYEYFVFIGCGSSYSIAKSGVAICNRFGFKSLTIAAGDFLVNPSSYLPVFNNAIIVLISRSGKTSEMIRAAEIIKHNCSGNYFISICATEKSPMSSLSDYIIELPWAFDDSTCQTRTVTNLYSAMALLISIKAGYDDLFNDFDKLIKNGPSFLSSVSDMTDPFKSKTFENYVVLSDAETTGIAEEGALAFNEICMKRSNYYHILDFRHGPMVLLNEHTLVIALLSSSENELQNKLLEDIKKRGSSLICVSANHVDCKSDLFISIPDYDHIIKGISLLNVLQVLTLGISENNGNDPDNPTGLDPWIVL